mgnify:CR=1 FL=1
MTQQHEKHLRKIIDRVFYDTRSATAVLKKTWTTQHPHCALERDRLTQIRAVYRTKKGNLFAYSHSEIGYGRDEDGVCGSWSRVEKKILPLPTASDAVDWLTEQGFPAGSVAEQFPAGLRAA